MYKVITLTHRNFQLKSVHHSTLTLDQMSAVDSLRLSTLGSESEWTDFSIELNHYNPVAGALRIEYREDRIDLNLPLADIFPTIKMLRSLGLYKHEVIDYLNNWLISKKETHCG